MPDMLVKLYTLPDLAPVLKEQAERGITIRRALAPERHVVIRWVRQEFKEGWASETEVAFSRFPVACFVAVRDSSIIGFADYDCTFKNFFGPTGVSPAGRGAGTGKALLLACLHAMHASGYGYAIIGGVGPAEFYTKTVGAVLIEGSEPGMYAGRLKT